MPVRVLEQIKLDVAHDNLPVVLLGDGAGFVYSHLGTSHQSTEDIACTRAIPGMTVLSPADRHEMTACMDHAYAVRGPVYLRMGKSDRGDCHPGPVPGLVPGRLLRLREGRADRPALIATGSMLRTALDIANAGLGSAVWSALSIKPLEADDVCAAARSGAGLVVLEEHSVLGGLGSAVAEILSERAPTRVLRIGVPDRFSERCGTHAYLLHEHGLDHDSVKARIDTFAAITPCAR